MVEMNTVVLENGIEYYEIDDIIYNNIRYILLSDVKNVKDSCIRKIVVYNNEECISKLDNDNEFETILNLFVEKNKTLFS